MGIGQSIAAAMGKQQQEAQKGMAARQLEMQLAMRDRMVATQIAFSRDLFSFFGTFCALAAVGLPLLARKKGNPAFMGPLVPLGFVAAYQYDLAYGTKMERVIAEADRVLANERHLLRLPGEPLSVEAMDAAVRQRAAEGAVARLKQLR